MSEEITFKIKKENLWKYSTFVLIAVIAVWAIVSLVGSGNSNNNYAANAGNTGQQANAGTGDFSFANDDSLYAYVGPRDADVTVIEFFDFQCPYCALAAGLSEASKPYATQYADLYGVEGKLRDLAEQGKIKLIFGIYSFLGAESGYAAEAALCANDQGKYEEMYDAIYTAHDMQENNGKYNKDKLEVLAAGISGLSTSKFNDCLESGKYTTAVQTMASNANAAGISGTPSFVVNGQLASGSWTELSSKLKALGVSVN